MDLVENYQFTQIAQALTNPLEMASLNKPAFIPSERRLLNETRNGMKETSETAVQDLTRREEMI